MQQDRDYDGLVETRLYLNVATRGSFRAYTVVAENAVAVNTKLVQLLQSTYRSLSCMVLSKECSLCTLRREHWATNVTELNLKARRHFGGMPNVNKEARFFLSNAAVWKCWCQSFADSVSWLVLPNFPFLRFPLQHFQRPRVIRLAGGLRVVSLITVCKHASFYDVMPLKKAVFQYDMISCLCLFICSWNNNYIKAEQWK